MPFLVNIFEFYGNVFSDGPLLYVGKSQNTVYELPIVN